MNNTEPVPTLREVVALAAFGKGLWVAKEKAPDLYEEWINRPEIVEAEGQLQRICASEQLKLVQSANCILQADEPAIDEIWFDYEIDGQTWPMRQDTLTSHLQTQLEGETK